MYFRVFIKFRVCTCIHDTRYTIHDIDEFRVYTVTSLDYTLRWDTKCKFVHICSLQMIVSVVCKCRYCHLSHCSNPCVIAFNVFALWMRLVENDSQTCFEHFDCSRYYILQSILNCRRIWFLKQRTSICPRKLLEEWLLISYTVPEYLYLYNVHSRRFVLSV